MKRAEKFEDIDLNYVNPQKEGELFGMCEPYLIAQIGSCELVNNTPKEIEELYQELLKYRQARDDYERITGEELH